MDWNEVYLTMQGIVQMEAPLRRAAYLIHRSLVEKPVDILKEWPLSFDQEGGSSGAYEKLKKRLLEYKMRHATARA